MRREYEYLGYVVRWSVFYLLNLMVISRSGCTRSCIPSGTNGIISFKRIGSAAQIKYCVSLKK